MILFGNGLDGADGAGGYQAYNLDREINHEAITTYRRQWRICLGEAAETPQRTADTV